MRALLLLLLLSAPALGAAVPLKDKVRASQLEGRQAPSPYWRAFALKQAGDCDGAIVQLIPIAQRGFGFEQAQTTLGECYLIRAGVLPDFAAPDAPDAPDYHTGVRWIMQAANADDYNAQALLVELYGAGYGVGYGASADNDPSAKNDPIEGAKWAHLYLNNAARQNLGVPILAESAIEALRAQLSERQWLLGKERARQWTPLYAKQNPEEPIKETP